MQGQRRFVLFAFLAFVIVPIFWTQPDGAQLVKPLAHYTGLYKSQADQAALEDAPPEYLNPALSQIVYAAITTIALPTQIVTAPFVDASTPIISTTPSALPPVSFLSDAQLSHVAASSVEIDDPTTVTEDAYAYLTQTSATETIVQSAHHATNVKETMTNSGVAHLAQITASIEAFGHDEGSTTTSTSDAAEPTKDMEESEAFKGGYELFQSDVTDSPLPSFDIKKLKAFKPHNYKGPGRETYATFFSTRNTSLLDPYFLATQQLTYRLLWDPRSKSTKHPLTIFMAPWIPQEQRDYLRAAGANIRELDIITWQPTHPTFAATRWKDMFSKLNLWNQTEFSRVVYLDTDAFPIHKVDELFDIAQKQTCNRGLLSQEDQWLADQLCDYTFTAVEDIGGLSLNAGMLIFDPSSAMHARLLRESVHTDRFNQDVVEQGFLNYAYAKDGAFPYQSVGREWNAVRTNNDDEGRINVIHEKLWAMLSMQDHFAAGYWRTTWDAMLTLYSSPQFEELRAADGVVR